MTIPLLAALCLFTGCATPIEKGPVAAPIWRLLPPSASDAVVAQTRSGEAIVSVLCMNDGCRLLIVSSPSCEANETILVMINTEVETGVSTALCLPTEQADQTDPTANDTGAIYLETPNLLLPQIVLGDDTTIAVPYADSRIEVHRIPMKGLRTLMESANPEVFNFPDLSDGESVNPYSLPVPPDMNQDQLKRWQRGLESI